MIKQSFPQSLRHAVDGVCSALVYERNMRIHFALTLVVLLWDLVVRPNTGDVVVSVAVCASVIRTELLNTAVERVTDLASDRRPTVLAKQAKDMAAGAVLSTGFAALASAVYLTEHTYPWHWRLWTSQHMIGAGVAFLTLIAWMGVVLRSITHKLYRQELSEWEEASR